LATRSLDCVRPTGRVEQQESGQAAPCLSKLSVPHFILLVFLFLAACAIRIHYLDQSRIVAEVQFRQALIARAWFFEMNDSIPIWRREANANSLQRLPDRHKEPSIMEALVAVLYRCLDREDLRIPRALASVFWLLGGLFLYKIVSRVTSRDAAVISTGYYLFLPLGVVVSTSFQPDSLMVMMFIISIYTILRYDEQPSMLRLVGAAAVSALAILVKPLVLSALLGAFLSLAIYRSGSLKRVVDGSLVMFIALSLLPAGAYYGREIMMGGFLTTQAQVSFLPQLWLTRDYWKDWLWTATAAIGLSPLVAALLGIPLSRSGALRALLIGLWGGYGIFCLAFTYHIRYAGYYHLQLTPVGALSFAPLTCLIVRHLRRLSLQWFWFLPVSGALALVALSALLDIRGVFRSQPIIESVEVAERIGDIVNHSNKTVYIASYYGRPLEYYGELSGAYWPRTVSDTDRSLGHLNRERTVDYRIADLGFVPEYYVITSFEEFEAYHADLGEYLIDNCSLVAQNADFEIYSDCSRD
jgi:hypothetical protein